MATAVNLSRTCSASNSGLMYTRKKQNFPASIGGKCKLLSLLQSPVVKFLSGLSFSTLLHRSQAVLLAWGLT